MLRTVGEPGVVVDQVVCFGQRRENVGDGAGEVADPMGEAESAGDVGCLSGVGGVGVDAGHVGRWSGAIRERQRRVAETAPEIEDPAGAGGPGDGADGGHCGPAGVVESTFVLDLMGLAAFPDRMERISACELEQSIVQAGLIHWSTMPPGVDCFSDFADNEAIWVGVPRRLSPLLVVLVGRLP